MCTPVLRGFGVRGGLLDQIEADPETAESWKMGSETKRCGTVGHSLEEEVSLHGRRQMRDFIS